MAKDVSALLPESSGLIITLIFLALCKVNGPGYSPGGNVVCRTITKLVTCLSENLYEVPIRAAEQARSVQ